MKKLLLTLFVLTFVFTTQAQKQKKENAINFAGLQMSGDWFIAHSNSKKEGEDWTNSFKVKRSYFTLKKEINNIFSVRYTQDITLDNEGDDRGNVETRMKYLYLKIKPQWENTTFTGTFFEIGMVHRPWITYEQKVNHYRVQGNMAVERNGLYNSAGFGILLGGNIGPKMDKAYLKEVSSSMKGKWASFAIGLYNGGGYSKFEENLNKVVEGTIHLRPFANSIPQIQLTTGFNIGKGNKIREANVAGNIPEDPDFQQFLFHGAYVGKYINLGAQYHFGKGDFKGKMADATNKAYKNNGYSFFGEYKFEKVPFSIFARYDFFNIDETKTEKIREIAGIRYTMYKGIHVLLTAENDITEISGNKMKDVLVDLSLQISF